MTEQLLRLSDGDDVAIALDPIARGATVSARGGAPVTVSADIPRGHKVALREVPAGDLVRKYGHVIGVATAPIAVGEHVHVHNLAMPAGASALASGGGAAGRLPDLPADLRRTFQGIRRPDGQVATRNYVGVLTTVNCSATVARQVVRRTEDEVAALHAEGVDGVVALTHGTGCGMASRGTGWDVLQRTLQGYARHPNIGALVVLGLGCEVNAVSGLMADLGLDGEIPVESFTIQDAGGTAAAIAQGEKLVRGMAADLRGTRREEVGVEHLVLGLQCGGSDAWSGLTANPALGVASDLLVAAGGTSVLGETPEVYGAEQMLAERAARPRGGAGAARPDRVVGGLHDLPGHDAGRQPLTGQQGGRHHHHPREVARRGRQGRPQPAARRVRLRRADPATGLRLHGHPRLRPRVGHGHGGRRRQPHLLHHRARLRLREPAGADGEAGDQLQPRRCGCPATWTSTARPWSSRACRWRRWGARSTTCCSTRPPVAAASARSWHSAARSSCRGSSGPCCDPPVAGGARGGPARPCAAAPGRRARRAGGHPPPRHRRLPPRAPGGVHRGRRPRLGRGGLGHLRGHAALRRCRGPAASAGLPVCRARAWRRRPHRAGGGPGVRRAVRRGGGPAPDGPLRRPRRPARHPDRHGEGLPPRVRRRPRPRRPGGGRRPRRRSAQHRGPAGPRAAGPAGRVGRCRSRCSRATT